LANVAVLSNGKSELRLSRAVVRCRRAGDPGLPTSASAVKSVLDIRQGQPIEIEFATDSPLEEAGFELVWGFSCQVVFWFVGGSLFGAGKPFFVPSPAIRFAERAERGQGIETVAKLGGWPPSDACVSQRLRPEHASDDELRRGFLHSFGIWAVPPLMIRGELAMGAASCHRQTCMR